MRNIIVIFAILISLACTKQEFLEGGTNPLTKDTVQEKVKTTFISNFTDTNQFGIFPGWYDTGLPESYNTYKVEPYNNQCKITIRNVDTLKYLYLKTFTCWFVYQHVYKVSLDVVDISTWQNMSMLNIPVFAGDSTRFISRLGQTKDKIVKHWEWNITANTVEPMQLMIGVYIPTRYILPDNQWIIINNVRIEEQ